MPSVPSGSSSFAPSVANANGLVAVAWSDSSSQQIFLTVFDVTALSWSTTNVTMSGCSSAVRPTLTYWNGVFYLVFRGVGSDTRLFGYITDLAFFPSGPSTLGTNNSAAIPWTFPLPDQLIITENAAPGPGTTQVTYFTLAADWLTAAQSTQNGLSTPTTVTLTNSSVTGACVLAGPTAAGVLWCAVYGGSSAIYFNSCLDQQWSPPTNGQVGGDQPKSSPAATIYDGKFYVVWVDGTLGVVYAVGTPQSSGAGITWGAPIPIPSLPAGITDVSITAGDGVFVGYCVPASTLGFVQLQI